MHRIEDLKTVDITIYQLPETLTLEELERLPAFMGLPGIERRRQMPGRTRKRAYQPALSADILQRPGRE